MNAKAQYVTIPDTNFVNWLNTHGYAGCMVGDQMDTTCNKVVNDTIINCINKNINDLTGISYFDNLKYLDCYANQLTNLPNLPYSLKKLDCSSNNLSYLPNLPSSLIELLCGSNKLDSLPPLPNLEYLQCYFNYLTNLPNLPASITWLDCHGNQLSALPNLPNSLTYLQCGYNSLFILPILPLGLEILACEDNQLTSLPPLPSTLTSLKCTFNQISSLPNLPLMLTEVYCGHNLLTTLPSLPATVMDFRCNNNQITSMPALPDSLKFIFCGYNQLSYLPSLPNFLIQLSCDNNNLDSLPSLPTSLSTLQCYFNNLASLPVLPSQLSHLSCDYNQLLTLGNVPPDLLYLGCSYNQLISLPTPGNKLRTLGCNNNQLSSLPFLPDTMIYLNIQSNLNLTCLPPIKRIDDFHWIGTSINCLSNVLSVNTSNPSIFSVPICNLFNSNNCHVYWNISGQVYKDDNGNCMNDNNELSNRNIKLNLYQNGNLVQQTFTNALGQYSFDTNIGNYQYSVDTTDMFINIACPPMGVQTSILTMIDSVDDNMDFGINCKNGFDIGVNTLLRNSGRFRPGNYATVNVLAGDISNHYNLHCATGISGTVTVIFNGPVSYTSISSGALIPVVNGDTIVYSIADFGTVNFQNDFSFIVQTDTTAQAGDLICFDVTVTPMAGDNNTTNNFYAHCFDVTNSFDPNEKEVSPPSSIDTSQNWLTYTIYFQNTGNDTALHVYVLDTLDNAIDESSIQLLAYSHEPLVQVMGKIVKFNFPTINLPDSTTDEPNSHGYVQYKVRIKDNTTVGTMIHNTGYIYFDFNAPVVTNTTFNQIDIITLLSLPSPKERELSRTFIRIQ